MIKRNSGFTLVELIVTLVIAGVAGTTLVLVTSSTLNTVDLLTKNGDINRVGTRAVQFFSRDAFHLGDQTAPIFTADRNKVKFKTVMGRPVEYYFLNGNLYLDVGGNNDPGILCSGVDMVESSFKYYDNNGNEMTDVPLTATRKLNVYSIELNLSIGNQDISSSFTRKVTPANHPWRQY